MDNNVAGQTEENEQHHSELNVAMRVLAALAVFVALAWLFG